MSRSSRLFLLYICGKFILTIGRALGAPRRGNARNKLGEFHQINEPQKRSPLPHDNVRIDSGDVGPLRRNRANRVVVDAQQQPLAIPVIALAHANELAVGERMEWVNYPHKLRRRDGKARVPR
jgi:hypothetical protein